MIRMKRRMNCPQSMRTSPASRHHSGHCYYRVTPLPNVASPSQHSKSQGRLVSWRRTILTERQKSSSMMRRSWTTPHSTLRMKERFKPMPSLSLGPFCKNRESMGTTVQTVSYLSNSQVWTYPEAKLQPDMTNVKNWKWTCPTAKTHRSCRLVTQPTAKTHRSCRPVTQPRANFPSVMSKGCNTPNCSTSEATFRF